MLFTNFAVIRQFLSYPPDLFCFCFFDSVEPCISYCSFHFLYDWFPLYLLTYLDEIWYTILSTGWDLWFMRGGWLLLHLKKGKKGDALCTNFAKDNSAKNFLIMAKLNMAMYQAVTIWFKKVYQDSQKPNCWELKNKIDYVSNLFCID